MRKHRSKPRSAPAPCRTSAAKTSPEKAKASRFQRRQDHNAGAPLLRSSEAPAGEATFHLDMRITQAIERCRNSLIKAKLPFASVPSLLPLRFPQLSGARRRQR
ncbi:hypothetical protein BLJAPNOD_03892 [Ensifer sp. M14]|nr:hypothetical protein BLJAPNOD_03892 [Ensifer sp. M14]